MNEPKLTYGYPQKFFNDVDGFYAELDALASSFCAIETCNDANMLEPEAFHNAVFGIRIALDMMVKRLQGIVEGARSFPCIREKEDAE